MKAFQPRIFTFFFQGIRSKTNHWLPVFPSIRNFSTVAALKIDQKRRNLFDIPEELITPKHFIEKSHEAVAKINFIRQYLPANVDQLSHSEKLRCFDAISVELCNIIDAAEFCRNAHMNPAFQQSAEESFTILSQVIIDLNSDVTLYDILEELLRTAVVVELTPTTYSPSSPSSSLQGPEPRRKEEISREEYLFAEDLITDFRMEGIHLIKQSAAAASPNHANSSHSIATVNLQQFMKQKQQEIVETETIFSQNIREQTNSFSFVSKKEREQHFVKIGPFDLSTDPDRSEYSALSEWLKQQVSSHSNLSKVNSQSGDKGYLHSPPTRALLGAMMPSISNESLRQLIWFENMVQPFTNLHSFQNLLFKRHQLSKLLGFQNYSQKILTKSIYKHPHEIQALLKSLSQSIQSQTIEEIEQLRNMKRQLQQMETKEEEIQTNGLLSKFLSFNSSSSSPKQGAMIVQPWDIGYLQHAHLSLVGNGGSGKSADAQQRIREYFPLSQCLNSLEMISREVFSLLLIEEQLQPNEIWIDPSLLASGTSGIKKYVVYDEKTRQKVGIVYLDLYERPGKFPGAAHFTIRCGCEKLHWKVNPLSTRTDQMTLHRSSKDLFDIAQQLPIVVLVWPFNGSNSSNNNTNRSLDNVLLSLSGLESLYHEWGHALHSLLSRTKFQHLSGTRGSTDFIEIPSHFMEYFARDAKVIQKWAKHYHTGETVPAEFLEDALIHRKSFTGMDLQTQILFAAADQHLFSSSFLDQDIPSPDYLFCKSLEEVAKIQEEYTILPFANTHEITMIEGNPQTIELKKTILQTMDSIPNMQLLQHGHFINYGSSYYSYLLARIYAAQIWYQLFQKDPLSREAGKIIRDHFLSYGSSKPGKELLDEIVGKEVDPSYFIQTISR